MTGQVNEFVVDKQAETWRLAFPRWLGRIKQRLFFWQGPILGAHNE
jgi:hypothetical protein